MLKMDLNMDLNTISENQFGNILEPASRDETLE